MSRVGGGQVGIRRAVDIRCGSEGVEAPLRRGDRGIRIGDSLRAGVHFLLRGGRVVARRLHVDDRFVHAFLLRLDRGPEVLQFLVGVGHGRDKFAEGVRTGGLSDGQAGSREQHADRKRHRADPRGASHSTRVSYGSHANVPAHSWVPVCSHKNHNCNISHRLHGTSHLTLRKL